MALRAQDLQALVAAFDASDWDELTLTLDGERVLLSKTGRPPAAAEPVPTGSVGPGPRTEPSAPLGSGRLPAPAEAGAVGAPAEVSPVPAVAAPEQETEVLLEPTTRVHRVLSPSVGVFWRAPAPSAPPFADVGQRVEADEPVCIVEVMKLFNHVQAGASGTVRSVEVADGEMVEHGQLLFVLDMEG